MTQRRQTRYLVTIEVSELIPEQRQNRLTHCQCVVQLLKQLSVAQNEMSGKLWFSVTSIGSERIIVVQKLEDDTEAVHQSSRYAICFKAQDIQDHRCPYHLALAYGKGAMIPTMQFLHKNSHPMKIWHENRGTHGCYDHIEPMQHVLKSHERCNCLKTQNEYSKSAMSSTILDYTQDMQKVLVEGDIMVTNCDTEKIWQLLDLTNLQIAEKLVKNQDKRRVVVVVYTTAHNTSILTALVWMPERCNTDPMPSLICKEHSRSDQENLKCKKRVDLKTEDSLAIAPVAELHDADIHCNLEKFLECRSHPYELNPGSRQTETIELSAIPVCPSYANFDALLLPALYQDRSKPNVELCQEVQDNEGQSLTVNAKQPGSLQIKNEENSIATNREHIESRSLENVESKATFVTQEEKITPEIGLHTEGDASGEVVESDLDSDITASVVVDVDCFKANPHVGVLEDDLYQEASVQQGSHLLGELDNRVKRQKTTATKDADCQNSSVSHICDTACGRSNLCPCLTHSTELVRQVFLWMFCYVWLLELSLPLQYVQLQRLTQHAFIHVLGKVQSTFIWPQTPDLEEKSQHNHSDNRMHNQHPNETDEKDFGDKLEHEEALRELHTNSPINRDVFAFVIAQYQENRNPNLPLDLQQLLDGKSPREFLTYVLNDLSIEQREALMCDEEQRRKSFLAGWPHISNSSNLSGIKMAQAGLYYLGEADHVQCVFCRGRLHSWDLNDVPMVEHARMFNFCRFVKNLSCGNIEYRSRDLSENDLQHVTQFGNPSNDISQRGADGGSLGISTVRAAVIRYAPKDARLRTYARWPINNAVVPERLCDGGFHYTGFDDQVRCFFCAGSLRDWSEGDDPWEEHARWFPNCLFLLNQKGPEYIKSVRQQTPVDKKSSSPTIYDRTDDQGQTQHSTTQEDMRSCCLELGHSADAIDMAIAIHGRPFNDIKDLIEALYALEENGPEIVPAPVMRLTERIAEYPEADRQLFAGQESNSRQRMLDRFETSNSQNNCRICQIKTGSIIPALHVGLPCGHLIYCDACKEDEARKSSASNYIAKCPYPRCGASLNGTIRVYFA